MKKDGKRRTGIVLAIIGAFELFKTKHGLVAAGMPNIRYRDFTLRLEPGDKLFLYTDGIPEATDAQNGMFGMKRTLAALNANRDKSPEEIIKGVRADVNAFTGDAPQFDDVTMLCVQYNGPERPGGTRTLTLEAKRENLPAVTAFVEEALDGECPMKTKMQLDVAVDEIFTNISDYAYPDGVGTATVQTERNDGVLTVTFADRGIPFDPLTAQEPDVTASAQDRRIGGLGIFLVRKTMDEVHYEYRDGQNVLRIRKSIRMKQ